MADDDIIIGESKLQLLNGKLSQIEDVFGIKIWKGDPKKTNQSYSSFCDSVRITSNHPNEDYNDKAKEYIQCVLRGEDISVQTLDQSSVASYGILTRHDIIERDSGATLVSHSDNNTLHVIGLTQNVAVAMSLIQQATSAAATGITTSQATAESRSQRGQDLLTSQGHDLGAEENQGHRLLVALRSGSTEDEGQPNRHVPVVHTLSPGGESIADSCYNSDTSPGGSRRNSSQRLDLHDEVSRTTSDTLASELKDDPPEKPKSKLIIDGEDESSDSSNGSGASWSRHRSQYASKIEFAIKLGYTEAQLQAAIEKLGSHVNDNELLDELIKLSRSEVDVPVADPPVSERSSQDKSPVMFEDTVRTRGDQADVTSADDISLSVLQLNTPSNTDSHNNSNLRQIVIDGSNVAMSHGNKEVFSCRGIKLAVDWFRERGHEDIVVFVPQWRKEASRPDTRIVDQEILYELEKDKILVFTPARRVGGKRVVCYDDRYIIKLAASTDGVVVSNDNYRDLISESNEFKKVIEERLLMYSFVNDRFMPPDDPLGRHGPNLDNFLQKEPTTPQNRPPICPYDKKCTYGNKCKYYHPERGSMPHKSVTDKLKEQAAQKIKEAKERIPKKALGRSQSSGEARSNKKKPLSKTQSAVPTPQKTPLSRTRSLVPGSNPAHAKPLSKSSIFGSLGTGPVVVGGSSKDQQDLVEKSQSKTRVALNENVQQHHKMPVKKPLALTKSWDAATKDRHQIQHDIHQRGEQSLKPPNHWSLTQTVLPSPTPHDPHDLSGHLALAKKLSDEGKRVAATGGSPGQAGSPRESGLLDNLHPALTVSYSSPAEPQKPHMKLQRQLSLKGSEDPRLLNVYKSDSNSGGSNQQQPTPASSSWFHRPLQEPVQPQQHQPAPASWFHTPSSQPPVQHQQAQGQQVHMSQAQPAHKPLTRHTTLPANFVLQQDQQQQQQFKSHGRVGLQRTHAPIGRTGSVPVTYHSMVPSHEGRVLTPVMSRQNSSSDSKINLHFQESESQHQQALQSVMGDPRWAFQPPKSTSGSGDGLYDISSEQNRHSPQYTDNKHEELRRKASGGLAYSFGSDQQSLYANPKPPEATGYSQPHIQGDLQGGPYIHPSRRSPSPSQPFPPQMMSPHPFPAQQREAHYPSQQPRDTQFPTQQALDNQFTQQRDNTQYLSYPPPQPIGSQSAGMQIDVSRPPPSMSPQQPSPGAPLAPDNAKSRANMYYHLCGLFEESKVLRVMQLFPSETDPKKMCHHLLAMPD